MTTLDDYGSVREQQAMAFSQHLAEITGGRYFEAKTPSDTRKAFLELAAELENQYAVTIQLQPSSGERKWRDLKLKISKASKLDPEAITLRTRKGIYF